MGTHWFQPLSCAGAAAATCLRKAGGAWTGGHCPPACCVPGCDLQESSSAGCHCKSLTKVWETFPSGPAAPVLSKLTAQDQARKEKKTIQKPFLKRKHVFSSRRHKTGSCARTFVPSRPPPARVGEEPFIFSAGLVTFLPLQSVLSCPPVLCSPARAASVQNSTLGQLPSLAGGDRGAEAELASTGSGEHRASKGLSFIF